jgi:hypothetical protein
MSIRWLRRRLYRTMALLALGSVAARAAAAQSAAPSPVPSPATPVAPPPLQDTTVTGQLVLVWGDPQDNGYPRYQVLLTDVSGRMHAFAVDAGDVSLVAQLQRVSGQRATLEVESPRPAVTTGFGVAPLPRIRGVHMAAGTASPAALAHAVVPAPWTVERRPYAVVMCRFADVDSVPFSREELTRMYLTGRGSTEDYYREVSRGRITFDGTTVTPWVRLPRTRSGYLTGDSPNLAQLSTDCLGAADSIVDYRQVRGVGMHFNSAIGCCSWGGGTTVAFDGPSRGIPAMWNMSWARSGVIWHEMGHSLGLPHSGGPYFATYDSRWDVMSSAGGGLYFDQLFGGGGSHFVGWHKDRLGLIPDSSRVEVTGPEWRGLVSAHAEGDGPGAQYLTVPLLNGAPGALLTIEARRRVGYDLNVPSEGIVIGTVDPARAEPAHVVDVDGNGNVNDRGAVWRVGQRFLDAARGVSVAVDSQVAAGWWITVQRSGSGGATPRFERNGVSVGVGRVTDVVRDSVRVLAAGPWRIRSTGVPDWVRLERSSGAGAGWFVYTIVGAGLPQGRGVSTLSFEVAASQYASTFRIEAGLTAAPEDLAFLSRPSRRIVIPSGGYWSPYDTISVRLTGVWATASWSFTPSSRYFFYGLTGAQPQRIARTGQATLGYVVNAGGGPAGTQLVDTLRITVQGPSTVVLTMIDTIVVGTPSGSGSWTIGARPTGGARPFGLARLDSALVSGTGGGTWTAFRRRRETQMVRREGTAGDWVVWTRQSPALGLSVDTITIQPAGQTALTLVDSITWVDVPLRLTANRTSGSATVTLGQSARFDSTVVSILGSAGTGLRWSAASSSPSMRLHFNGAFVAQASGETGQTLRWSRDIASLMPGQYVDTIRIVVPGAANSPMRLVDTTVVSPPPQRVGDVDNDGQVTAADGVALLRWLIQLPISPRAEVARTGDANCDGRVTVADALLLLQVDAGLALGTSCIGRAP